MPRKISEPRLKSARELTAFEQAAIHFGRPALQTPSDSSRKS